jgi:hypothetical protein
MTKTRIRFQKMYVATRDRRPNTLVVIGLEDSPTNRVVVGELGRARLSRCSAIALPGSSSAGH